MGSVIQCISVGVAIARSLGYLQQLPPVDKSPSKNTNRPRTRLVDCGKSVEGRGNGLILEEVGEMEYFYQSVCVQTYTYNMLCKNNS